MSQVVKLRKWYLPPKKNVVKELADLGLDVKRALVAYARQATP